VYCLSFVANMQAQRTISSLGLESLVTRIVALGLGFVGAILLARGLGPAARGLYAVVVTVSAMGYALGNVGLELAQFRAWAQKVVSADVLITTGALLAAALGGVTVALGLVVYALGRDSLFSGVSASELLTALLSVPIQLHSVALTGLLLMAGELRWTNLALLVGTGVHACAVLVLFLLNALTLEAALLAYLGLNVATWALLLSRLGKVGRPARRVPLAFLRRQLRAGVVVYPFVVLHFLNLRIDVLLLASFGSKSDVGLYAVAVTFAELMWFFSDAVIAPVIERQANAPTAEAVRVTVLAVRMSIVVVTAAALTISLVATFGIGLLYGSQFTAAREAVWVLAPAAVAMAIWRPLVATLLRTQHAAWQSVTALVALGINIGVNILRSSADGIWASD
jgi:O-antigen/teichoic acid export membrane protein